MTTRLIKEIVHYTTVSNMTNIIRQGMLYNQPDRAFIDYEQGQGLKNRTIASMYTPLIDRQYYHRYDEATGVYFRVEFCADLEKRSSATFSGHRSTRTAKLVFSSNLLDRYMWILNTQENNGFVFGYEGVYSTSPFSGDVGCSWFNRVPHDANAQIESYNSELVIPVSIDLLNLVRVEIV